MMDISNATTLAAAIVALIAPALIQALKKYIPEGFTALTSLGVSLRPPMASPDTGGASCSPLFVFNKKLVF